MNSDDSLSISVESFEGSKREVESNRLNSKHKQMENAETASGEHDVLTESVKLELGIINNRSTDVNILPTLRVPKHIKQSNPDAYKPRLISVGPVHHGKPELWPMEAFKRTYALNFMEGFSITIPQLIEVTKNHEEELRKNYGITSLEIPSDEFVKVMVIDAAFLVEFLWVEQQSGPFNEKWNNVISDLFLLENQIPFNYLSKILASMPYISLLGLCNNFLDNIRPFDIGRRGNKRLQGEAHLLDMLRTRMAHTTNGTPEICKDLCPTISQLHRAGIKFRLNGKSHELTFQQGILKIPKFAIDHNTGRYFANLVASELFACDRYASDYIAIMDYLINGPEDVRILVERGILENYLEDDKAAASFINEIGKSIYVSRGFHYKPLVESLKAHCKRFWTSPWSRSLFEWKRELKTNYFGNPWKVISVIAALSLLGLTVTQTVCSLLQLKG